jgi:hypothetical protein
LGVVTVVVSAATLAAATFLETGVLTAGDEGATADGCVTEGSVDDAVPRGTETESFATAFRGVGFGAGNSS